MKIARSLSPLEGHTGFTAPRYERANRTADALLRAGRQLLRTRQLESLTIQEVCARARVSNGSFYGRFESKDAFLRALLALSAQEVHDAMQRCVRQVEAEPGTMVQTVHLLLREMRRVVLRHEGVLRATMIGAVGKGAWDPFKQRGLAFVDQVLPLLEAVHGGLPSEHFERRVRFAFQMMISTIMNAMLNNPGPLLLSSHELDEELTAAFCAYVNRP